MRWLPVSAACLALAACASGGGGGSGPAVTPTPAPTPTPTPTSANVSLSALMTSQDFVNDAATGVAAKDAANTVLNGSAGAQTLTVHYDAASQGYAITAPGRSQTFLPADKTAGDGANVTYSKTDRSIQDTLTLVKLSPSPLYVGLGFWERDTTNGAATNVTYDSFTYGIPSPVSAVPRTGVADYVVSLYGYLTGPGVAPHTLVTALGDFAVDFAGSRFATSMSPNYQIQGQPYPVVFDGGTLVASGSLSSSDSTFSGSVSFSSYSDASHNATGAITGRFYGPSAQQLGATFEATGPSGVALTGSLAGGVVAGLPATNFALDNITTKLFQPTTAARLSSNLAGYQYASPTTPLSWNGSIQLNADKSFAITTPESSLASLTFTPANKVAAAAANFTTYQGQAPVITNAGGQTVQASLYTPGAANSELQLQYTSLAMWQEPEALGKGTLDQLFISYGIVTPLPVTAVRTGTAVYNGVVYGAGAEQGSSARYNITGTSQFGVNFSAQTFTASLAMSGAPVAGGAAHPFALSASGALSPSISLGQTVGLAQFTSAGSPGMLSFGFYGPQAEELGGTFAYLANDPMTGHTVSIAGATVAKR